LFTLTAEIADVWHVDGTVVSDQKMSLDLRSPHFMLTRSDAVSHYGHTYTHTHIQNELIIAARINYYIIAIFCLFICYLSGLFLK